MLFLLLVSYALKSSVALPLQEFNSNSLLNFLSRDVSSSTSAAPCVDTRSLLDILWSCIATIFACTWISIHPNVPDFSLGQTGLILRRVKIMVFAFLVPEFIITWAIRQNIHASMIAERYKDQTTKPKEWTKMHGFFLQMGGFVLYKNGEPAYTILPHRFEQLVAAKEVEFPRVQREDIADRSKGDFFTKSIVLIQTMWFVMQCIARWLQGLGLTQLEVVALALAVLNGFIFALWWSKPLDVQWHVRVDWKPQEEEGAARSEDSAGDQEIVAAYPHSVASSASDLQGEYESVDNSSDPANRDNNGYASSFSRFISRIVSWIRYLNQNKKTTPPIRFIFHALRFPLHILLAVIEPIAEMMMSTESNQEPVVVPMFYAPRVDGSSVIEILALLGGFPIGSIFGAVHCVAWSFPFSSSKEQDLWRISAVIITAVPILFLFGMSTLLVLLRNTIESAMSHNILVIFKTIESLVFHFGIYLIIACFMTYMAARVALLVLAIISLRNLSPNALLQINWVTLFPHL